MTMFPSPTTRSRARLLAAGHAARRGQRGVVLFVALIVLVAMTLAGIALMRSVDTALVVAGNMAFKQSAIAVADRGTQEAVKWLKDTNTSAPTSLYDDIPSSGYFALIPPGLPEPDWFDGNTWVNSFSVNGGTPDAAGNVTRYQIHRQCNAPGNPGDAGCGLYFGTSTAASGGSMAVGAPVYIGTPQIYYRVTTRVDGPRDTVSIIQSSVLVSVGS